MKKLVIFNVGGAFSSYLEIDEHKAIIDLGKSSDFSPVSDFLLPLADRRYFRKKESKFYIDQLFLSHLDTDHISDYEDFRKNFYVNYMTCPNDNKKIDPDRGLEPQDPIFRVDRSLFLGENNIRNLVLSDMASRNPCSPNMPLKSIIPGVSLFFIPPQTCKTTEELLLAYANNISLVLYLNINNRTVLYPGDLLSEGMKFLIESNSEFSSLLQSEGVNYLIAPHHGLVTSFSEVLFATILNNKTDLNIISEKIRLANSNENRSNVDSRYYGDNYSTGDNSLGKKGVKTSRGHIIIDFDSDMYAVSQTSDIEDVFSEFT